MPIDSSNSFNDIYSAWYRKSFLFVKSYVHDDLAAEDIVSESLIKLWERMKDEPVEAIPPFLFAILKNRSLDYLKHIAIKQEAIDKMAKTLSRELEIRTNTLEATDPHEIFSAEVQQIMQTTLDSLPVKTKEIFLMSRFGDKTHKEIAELFDVSVKNVDYHIARAVKELRLALKDYLPLLGVLAFLNV